MADFGCSYSATLHGPETSVISSAAIVGRQALLVLLGCEL